MNSQTVTVNLVPGLSAPAVIRVSQYDVGRPLTFKVLDGTGTASISASATATITGTKPSGLGFSVSGTLAGNTVTLNTTLAMTQERGKIPAEIRFTKTGEDIGTANFILAVEPSPHPDGTTDGTTETARTILEQATEAAQSAQASAETAEAAAEAVTDKYSAPYTVTSASQMTDETKVYLYEGNESGYTAGNWYYYNGSAWVSGGQYGEGVEIDTTLSVSGRAADAKVVGDEISNLKEDLKNYVGIKHFSEFTEGYYLEGSVNSYVVIKQNANCSYSTTPIFARKGQTVHCKSQGTGIACIATSETSDISTAISRVVSNDGQQILEYTYVMPNDGYVWVSSRTVALKAWIDITNLYDLSERVSEVEKGNFDLAKSITDFYQGSYNAQHGYVTTDGRVRTNFITLQKGERITGESFNSGFQIILGTFVNGVLTETGWKSSVDFTATAEMEAIIAIKKNPEATIRPAEITSDVVSIIFYRRLEEFIDEKVSGTNEIIENSYNSAFHRYNFWQTKAQEFSALIGDSIESESFLFFTDPHLCEGSNWESGFKEMMGQIQQCYNNTPTSFCLGGGDWLGNSDTVAEARYKLGLINGSMKSMFNRHYDLVGNHDTNAQGAERLSNNCIHNLWFRDYAHCYYSFKGQSTTFYCFNTGDESDILTTGDNYGWNMCKWFAESLLSDNSKHIALAMHIFYISLSSNVIHAITNIIFNIAKAYNSRTSIGVLDTTYNYSNATGKIEFAIAGHNHNDALVTERGIPVIITSNVRHDESKGATFDLIYVDYDISVVNLVRVGSGSDRTVNLT